MTEANKVDGIFNLTFPVVSVFPNLLVPKAYMKNGKAQGEAKYGITLLFNTDHPDLEAMKQLVAKLARHRWPDKAFSELALPFVNGDKLADKAKAEGKKEKGEYQRGKVIMKPNSKYEAKLCYVENGKIIDLETDTAKQMAKGKFYNGVEVLAQINFVPYDPIGENAKGGVKAYLNMILSTGKGTRLFGGASGSDVFKGYAGTVSAEDPTGGYDQIEF